jgi:hypothetical protein
LPLTKPLFRLSQLQASSKLLAVSRIAIGVCAFAVGWESWRFLPRILNPAIVQLPYFYWLPRLPLGVVPLFIGCWFIAALSFLLGFYTTWAGAVISLLSFYTLALDEQTYSNHFYLFFLIVLLLTIADSGAALSLDALRTGKKERVAGWPVLLLRLQVSLVYAFSALAKLTPQFLSGEILSQTVKPHGWLTFPQSWRSSQILSALAMSAIALELFVALALWSRRLRWAAVVGGLALHAFILTTLDSSRLSLGIFALEMFALYPLFFQDLRPVEYRPGMPEAR